MSELLWLIFSYLFSSFPNGYLIPKWFAGVDIRKIDKEKLSGSNIFQNVGFVPGLLSGLLDVSKGVVAVLGAQYFGFSMTIQAFAGICALCGQMWPVFMKFWGGRGGSACLGSLLVLSWQVVIVGAILWILCKIISREKGAPIGMMLFIILAAILGAWWVKIESVYIFSTIALILVLIQRLLGKPGTLKKLKDKKVFLYRFFLDRDTRERWPNDKTGKR